MAETGNLDTVAALYQCFRTQDYDGFRRLCADDLEWRQNPGFPGGGTWAGADAVIAAVFRSFDSEWEGWGYTIDAMIEAGGDAVLVIGRYTGRHRQSGARLEAEAVHLYTLAGDRIARFRQFADTKTIHDAMAPQSEG